MKKFPLLPVLCVAAFCFSAWGAWTILFGTFEQLHIFYRITTGVFIAGSINSIVMTRSAAKMRRRREREADALTEQWRLANQAKVHWELAVAKLATASHARIRPPSFGEWATSQPDPEEIAIQPEIVPRPSIEWGDWPTKAIPGTAQPPENV